jgi:hypothetical protein
MILPPTKRRETERDAVRVCCVVGWACWGDIHHLLVPAAAALRFTLSRSRSQRTCDRRRKDGARKRDFQNFKPVPGDSAEMFPFRTTTTLFVRRFT